MTVSVYGREMRTERHAGSHVDVTMATSPPRRERRADPPSRPQEEPTTDTWTPDSWPGALCVGKPLLLGCLVHGRVQPRHPLAWAGERPPGTLLLPLQGCCRDEVTEARTQGCPRRWSPWKPDSWLGQRMSWGSSARAPGHPGGNPLPTLGRTETHFRVETAESLCNSKLEEVQTDEVTKPSAPE